MGKVKNIGRVWLNLGIDLIVFILRFGFLKIDIFFWVNKKRFYRNEVNDN